MTVVRVTVAGRVQGVGYRAWTKREADRYQLAGWVRNRKDGAVEAVFAGLEDKVKAMVAACHQGPRHAVVTAVAVVPEDGQVLAGFEIRPTA